MSIRKKLAVIHNLTSGGAVRVLNEINSRLSRSYDIEIFRPPRYIKGTGTFELLNYIKYIYVTLPRSYKLIAEKVNKSNFDKVLLHHDAFLKSPLALLHLKRRSIYFLHEPPREFYEPLDYHAPLLKDKLFTLLRLPIKIIDKFSAKKATIVISNSYFSQKAIHRIYGINSIMIYPGVSDLFRTKCNVNRHNDLCISVGSLLPYKGHLLTIKALSKVKLPTRLIIIGRGRESERKKIINAAKKYQVRVEIRKPISDKQLRSTYCKSKLYINASYQEPFGLSSLEAVISGDMLVTVNECGTEELKEFFLDRVIVTNRNAEDIAKGIRFSLDNFSEQNITVPEKLTWEHYVKKITKLIEND